MLWLRDEGAGVRSGKRQRGRQPGEVFRVPDPAEPRFRSPQPARHPARYHVLLLVPALHIAVGFPPVAQHILNQIGAQKRHIERYRLSPQRPIPNHSFAVSSVVSSR
jgi:hypothetical protein